MLKNGHCVGGEQSGHIILSKYATTGDGILTAITLTECMLEAKKPLSVSASISISWWRATFAAPWRWTSSG